MRGRIGASGRAGWTRAAGRSRALVLVLAIVCVLVLLPVSAVAGTAPSNTALPTLSGKALDGQLLEATTGTWSGTEPITYAYQWQVCNRQGKECENLPLATEPSYRVSSADVEETIRVLVTATNSVGSASAASAVSAEIATGPPVALEAPVISGGAWEGETLSVSGEGWAGSGVEPVYQWRLCNSSGAECSDIAGATESQYTLSSADVGDTLRARVGAVGSAGSLIALSPPTLPVAAKSTLRNSWLPSLSGTAKAGQTLTANPGSWVGPGALSYAYQWQRCNHEGGECANISGATSSTYVLASGDVGKSDRVLVTTGEEESNTATVASAGELVASEKGPVLEGAPEVSGSGLPEYTLTAGTGKWSGTGVTYAYKWQKCNEAGEACKAISGATSRTYKLPTSAAGSTTRVLVAATASGSSTEALSAPVTVSATAVADVSLPMLSGTTQVAHTLSATTGIWAAAVDVTYAYQWERCNSKGESCAAISGATESTYTPVAADAGDTDRVKLTATAGSGKASAASAASGVIAAGSGAPQDRVAPSIEGATSSGSTLTAQHGLWFGEEPLTYGYQWEACNASGEGCTGIGGATSQTYVLGSGEVGSTIRVKVTAKNSKGEASATSPASEPIEEAAAPSVSERPGVTGTAQEGNELFAENGTWGGSQPLRYFYRWERCNTSGEACAAISGATKPGYKATSADVGSTLRVSVTVTNSLGGASSLSPQTAVVAGKEASAKEAMEIAEKTDPSVIATPSSATLEGQTIKPNAEDAGEGLAATSTLTSSWLSKETSGEFAVNTPIGEISLKPLATAANATAIPLIVNKATAVYAGTQAATDTIVRPEPLGATAMLQMRSSEAPTSFSWQVGLGANQKLQVLPNGSVAVTESGPGSGLEGEVEETEEEKPSNETPAETKGEEGYSPEAAAEALEKATPEEKLSKLAAASTASTGETKPKSGELQPQETKAEYEAAVTASSYAESHTENTTLMVVPAPTVLDAEGKTVSASLSVQGDTITLSITRGTAKYPVTAEISADAPTNAASARRTPAPTFGFSSQLAEPFEKSEEENEGEWHTVNHMDKNLTDGKAVEVKYARLIAPYNISSGSTQLKQWLKAVSKTELPGGAHLVPEITLAKCAERLENEEIAPSKLAACEKEEKRPNFPQIYYRDVLKLMRALIKGSSGEEPVRIWGAWNEPEESSLGSSPAKAAEVWGAAVRALHKAGCRFHCKVIAGEFTGYRKLAPNERENPKHETAELKYVTSYENDIVADQRKKKWGAGKPEIWGLHDYKDLKEAGETATAVGGKLVHRGGTGSAEAQAFVQGTHRAGLGHPQDWITENGVLLWERSGHTPLYGSAEAQRVAAEDFLELGKQSTGHIEADNYYEYQAKATSEYQLAAESDHNDSVQFDSALLSAEGTMPEDERPAYCVIALDDKGACPPAAKTQATVSGSVKSTGATASLVVNPSGALTKYLVEYGTTTSYGHTTTAATAANPIGEQSETAAIGGLEACTTYHYRAEAENEADEGKPAHGQDKTFKTAGCPVSSIASLDSSACGALTTGTVDCWGEDQRGQLGNGRYELEALPGEVVELTGVSEISGNDGQPCALLSSGAIDCWGENKDGQLGNGSKSEESDVPVAVTGITSATAVDTATGTGALGAHACALLKSGAVDCWGSDVGGMLGNGKTSGSYSTPVEVSGITNAVSVSVGGSASCAVLSTGHIKCWGETGASIWAEVVKDEAGSSVPVDIEGISTARQVSVGGSDACALLADGHIECWGYDQFGMLGSGELEGPEMCGENHCSRKLLEVVGISDAGAVSVPADELGAPCALLTTGSIKCWGRGKDGGLGNGEKGEKAETGTPVEVSGIKTATAVATGGGFATCALLSGGTVDCWGTDHLGALGYKPHESNEVIATPIEVAGI
jgi:alpha-tubulin suppressor-like RCC1 family protein